MTSIAEPIVLRSEPARAGRADDADPILTEVVRNGLNGAAEEMKVALQRTAFSPVIYEMIDFAAGLYDTDGRMLAQARALPCFIGTLGLAIEAVVEAVGGAESLVPGDVLWSTDGYANGSHPQDAVVVVPVFLGDELIGYSANKAHQLDLAAKDPYCTDTTDVYQEGVIFPGVKLYAAGVQQRDLYRTLIANSRFPEYLAGDVSAQIGSAHVGAAALLRLVERFGRSAFDAAVERMFDHGEQIVRAVIAEIPDGRYVAECRMDDNGVSAEPVDFTVAAEVRGSDIIIDFTDTPAQQPGPINCPWPTTVSIARMFVLTLVGGSDLPNEGHFRPVEVRATPGTIFYPESPAPIYLYGWPADNAFENLIAAMAPALPGRLPAGSGGDLCGLMFWGETERGLHLVGVDHSVGQGASAQADGPSPMVFLTGSGIRTAPVEVLEHNSPVVILRNELAPDSGGAGAHRGGLGIDVEYELGFDCKMVSVIERQRTDPRGQAGGGDARANRLTVNTPDGKSTTYGKVTAVPLPRGTRVLLETGGGGGWGDPADRSAEAIQRDVEAGYITG